jgi:hypothetical protein
MHKSYIAKAMQKTSTRLAVFFVAVGVMTVLLVPAIAEKADARTSATATMTGCCFFYDVQGQMTKGKFVTPPTLVGPSVLRWVTTGNLPLGGDEIGSVKAKVNFGNIQGLVEFKFSNPHIGRNTCEVITFGEINASCNISRSHFATANFVVSPITQENSNKYCNILDKFEDIEQTKAIREKLNC